MERDERSAMGAGMSGASPASGAIGADPSPAPAYALLPSKVRLPGCVGDAVERPGVGAKLDLVLERRLAVVVAPAGYGKTTAVASWARGLGARGGEAPDRPAVGWYTLGPQDCAMGLFWRYVCAALGAADPALERGLSGLRFSGELPQLLGAIDCAILSVAALPRQVVLVLDDFHAVQDDGAVVQAVRHLVQNLPQNMHLVVTSRRSVPLPLSKMRLAGQLVSLDEDDLRFSPAEEEGFFARAALGSHAADDPAPARAVAAQGRPCPYSPEALARIDAYTHGWPAGCRLVAMLGGPAEPDPDQVRAGMSEYLFEEVFLSLPADRRDFMVATSVVDSFCPSLAAALTGLSASRAHAMAEGLAASDLFVVRIEHAGSQSWYRYHPLLADMLRSRTAGFDAQALARGRRAACGWYVKSGYLDQAVDMLVELCDWDGLRDLIVANWKSLYMADSHATLVRWASRMPWPRVLDSPFLCAVLAMPYALMGKADLANSLIMGVMGRLKPGEDFLFALCMVQKAFLASFKARSSDMRAFAEKALKYLPEEEYYLRGMMFQVLASSYAADEPLRARALFLEAVQSQGPFGNKNLLCSALGNLALCCADLGLFDEASLHAHTALDLYEPDERPCKPMLGHSFLACAYVAYQAGRPDEALSCLEAYGRTVKLQQATPEMAAQASALRAKALLLEGEGEAAREAFTRAIGTDMAGAAMAFPVPSLVRPCAAAVRGQVEARLAAGGGHEGALRVLGALAMWCEGSADAAACEGFCAFADGVDDRERSLFLNAHVAAAMLCEQAALTQRAEAQLACVLRLVSGESLASPLRENAQALQPVARRLLAQSRDAGVVAAANPLLQAAGSPAGALGARPDEAALTARELDVMRLVAAGMSVAQAAEHMVVSRETVKKHLANIYAKLGVHSKMQAVALLRERGEL